MKNTKLILISIKTTNLFTYMFVGYTFYSYITVCILQLKYKSSLPNTYLTKDFQLIFFSPTEYKTQILYTFRTRIKILPDKLYNLLILLVQRNNTYSDSPFPEKHQFLDVYCRNCVSTQLSLIKTYNNFH